jgi:hypothetical protein
MFGERAPGTVKANLIEKKVHEQLRDRIFDQLVAGKVLDTFSEELEEADFSEETMAEIGRTFAGLSESEKRAVLAIPAQLRPPLFARYGKEIAEGRQTGSGMIRDILEKAEKYGFTLGFHLSPADIRPDKDGSWMIRGTEKDHRNNDMAMAYYSTDYSHRYLKKPSRYLYVIRAETGEQTSHHQDNDGTWGHASTLSIVDAIDMHALEAEMEARFKALTAGGQKEKEAA